MGASLKAQEEKVEWHSVREADCEDLAKTERGAQWGELGGIARVSAFGIGGPVLEQLQLRGHVCDAGGHRLGAWRTPPSRTRPRLPPRRFRQGRTMPSSAQSRPR